MAKPTSLCVMPVYNQVHELPKLLEKCRRYMPTDYLFIVDNGSDDGSAKLIDDSKFECVHLERNYGIGYALRLGAQAALNRGCQIVCNIAGNGKMLPIEMPRLLEPIYRDKADYVTGSRFLKGGAYPNLPLFRRVGIPVVVNTLVHLLFSRRITDATCGFRAYRTKLLHDPRVDWHAAWLNRYQFEYYLYAKAIKLGYRCLEVPCSMIYPPDKKNYSKIPPIKGWWQLMEAWIYVGMGWK